VDNIKSMAKEVLGEIKGKMPEVKQT